MTSPDFCSSIYGATGVTSLRCCSSLYGAIGVTSLKFCSSIYGATGVTSPRGWPRSNFVLVFMERLG